MDSNKRTLDFIVEGQSLRKAPGCDFGGIVRGTKGYLRACFVFGSGYHHCGKIAVFSNGREEYPVELVTDECIIPEQVLEENTFRISVIGIRPGYRIRTNAIEVMQYG